MTTSSAPFIRFAALLGVLASICPSQSISPRIEFKARTLRGTAQPGAEMNETATALQNQLRSIYSTIDSKRSLLIHTHGDWSSEPLFSFQERMKRAGRIVSSQAAAGMQTRWRTQAASVIANLPQSNLELAALVNRLDLATFQDDRWSGAEVRFVYADPNSEVKFRLILEFILPALPDTDFRALAAQWQSLSTVPQNNFGSNLKELIAVLDKQGYMAARLRTNSNLNSDGESEWFLTQWEFHPGSFAQTPLTDQVSITCTQTATAGGCKPYLELWRTFPTKDPPPDRWPIKDTSILDTQRRYDFGQRSSLSLSGDGPTPMAGLMIPDGLDRPSCEARDVIAIQQCVLCHGAETSTQFLHIGKKSNGDYPLSSFLMGNKENPTWEELETLNESAVFRARVTYLVPADFTCKDQSLVKADSNGRAEDRYYHDLGRRALFLAAALLKATSGIPTGAEDAFPKYRLKLVQRFSTKLSH
jgi:hypothetical protein